MNQITKIQELQKYCIYMEVLFSNIDDSAPGKQQNINFATDVWEMLDEYKQVLLKSEVKKINGVASNEDKVRK